MAKSLPIPNVVGGARIQTIDESTMKWRTLAECLDTPNSVKSTAKRLTTKGHRNLWHQDCLGCRKPLF